MHHSGREAWASRTEVIFILSPGSLRAETSAPRSDPEDPRVFRQIRPPFVCGAGLLGSEASLPSGQIDEIGV